VIVVHSPEDGYIPFDQGQRLFDAAPQPKILLPTAGPHMEPFDSRSAFRERFFDHFNRMANIGKGMSERP